MTCSKPNHYYPFLDSAPTPLSLPPPPPSSQIWINITYSYPYIQQFPPLFHNYVFGLLSTLIYDMLIVLSISVLERGWSQITVGPFSTILICSKTSVYSLRSFLLLHCQGLLICPRDFP